ncbi:MULTISPECIES: hypothetical protein [Chryseobacterium]|uniref:Uncharacterized protein n=1 Tax=Chryseobacterium bernardetii TaxID=1241978 RepID=A0A3G6U5P1_9FLAO|nr:MULTISPECIES: hypothetical protein [Chryseobacterium]AZB23561.1 hypothetical protein EG339_02430 [Chryseobacterium bernardetii]AZB34236.1 hypothetical protein EG351_11765 [Chryseobacterium bernardetii]UCA57872.1 hypothetical protein KB553_12440 [Chryseobacterium rhizoplanae]
MKKIISLFFVAAATLGLKAQIGINTANPKGTLDVEGETLVESYLIDTENTTARGNYLLLTRSKDSSPVGKVKLLDITLRNVAPVNMYTVVLKNVKQDEVVNLNTGLDADKYVVAITGAVFSDAVSATTTSTSRLYGAYSTEVTKVQQGGKNYQAINLSFKGAGTVNSQNGTWTLTLNVFEKSLVKDWGTFQGSVSAAASFSGVSTNTPLGLQ